MKIKYIDSYQRLVLNGEDCLIIPCNKSKAVINIDSDSLNRMYKEHGLKISFENFHVNGSKPTIMEKVKMIFRILLL